MYSYAEKIHMVYRGNKKGGHGQRGLNKEWVKLKINVIKLFEMKLKWGNAGMSILWTAVCCPVKLVTRCFQDPS